MSSARTARTRLLTAAAAAAITVLSLTACEDGSGARDEGPSSGASATPGSDSSGGDNAKPAPDDSKPADDAPAKETPAADGDDNSPSGGSGSDSGSDDGDAQAVTCQGRNTKTVAAPLKRPVNHMLLTVTNTGSTPCHLYGYPAVRFGEAQAVPPVIEDSKPQAVVTLAPGESGYSSVNLSAADGSGTHGHTAKTLTVYFQGRTADEDNLPAADPSLPAKGIYVDSSLKVAYWQQEMNDAISW